MKFRTILLGLAALFVAFNAAYFSVTGLSKLFAGASFAVILMAGSLEAAKLIAASFLHNYWDKLKWTLKLYLTTAITVLIIITSAGIYGFLTSAYQTTADQLTIIDKQVDVLEVKKERYQNQLDGYQSEREGLTQSIAELTKGLSNNVIQYKDRETGEIITTTSTSTRRVLEGQLNDMKAQRDMVSQKIEVMADSVTSLDIQIVELESNNDIAAEIGPLKYMAEITGKEMSTIVNWFALLIVFVFDPLAVTLVISFNRAVEIDKGEKDKQKIKKRELYGEVPEPDPIKLEESDVGDDEEVSDTEEDDDFLDEEVIIEEEPTPTDISWSKEQEEENRRKFQEMKARATYETSGWKEPYEGRPYYEHPWFDWKIKERWINDQKAVKYWLKNKGTKDQVKKFKSRYPDNFDSKTY